MHGNYLVVENKTVIFCSDTERKAGVPGCDWQDVEEIRQAAEHAKVPELLLAALFAANRQPIVVPKLENAKMVSPSVVRRIFAGKGWWDEFYGRYPGSRGLVRFSSPAFTQDSSKALVYVSHSCGGLCGTGWLVLLNRSQGTWRIESQSMIWVS
jgi:hypothetical protein